jgi:hypothetical protein
MPSNNHPSQLTPDERRRRITVLLATGLMRLGTSLIPPASAPPSDHETLSKSVPNRLAESPDKSVTVSAG